VKLSSEQINRDLHSKIRDMNYDFGNIVVGSSLEALLYAYYNDYRLLYTRLAKPWFNEHFEPDLDLSHLSIENATKKIISPNGNKLIGMQKRYLWEKIYFSLSLFGNIIVPSELSSIRISESQLKAFTDNARMVKIKYKNIFIFDYHNVYGVKTRQQNKSSDLIEVRDWFSVKSGKKHQYDYIDSDDNFVNKIIFYPTKQVNVTNEYKDAVSISYLKSSQLDDYEYSDVSSRFKTLHMMKESGIRGARNGKDQRDKTKYKYYSVKIEFDNRDIIYPTPKQISLQDNIFFNYDTLDDIMETGKVIRPNADRII
jgi:hypothetical protein